MVEGEAVGEREYGRGGSKGREGVW